MEEITIKSLRDKQKDKMVKTKDFLQKKTTQAENFPEKKANNKLGKIIKIFLLLFLIFSIGGIGGIYIDRIFLPNMLVKYPELNQYDFFKKVNERTTIVRETQEITITQEEGISEAIEKVQPTVVEIFKENAQSEFEKSGSGIILTSDGYILTSSQNIYDRNELGEIMDTETDIKVELKDGETYNAEIISTSSDYALHILKIEKNNLPVIPYANYQETKLGQKLIIIDSFVVTDIVSQIIEDYIAEESTDSSFQNRIKITQKLEENFTGAAVINLKGELVGMIQEEDLLIPFSDIENFVNESIKNNK